MMTPIFGTNQAPRETERARTGNGKRGTKDGTETITLLVIGNHDFRIAGLSLVGPGHGRNGDGDKGIGPIVGVAILTGIRQSCLVGCAIRIGAVIHGIMCIEVRGGGQGRRIGNCLGMAFFALQGAPVLGDGHDGHEDSQD